MRVGASTLDRVVRGAVLVLLIAFTVIPLISMFTTALHPRGTAPLGLSWPSDPQWGNFADAWQAANFPQLILSSTLIVLGVVPLAVIISTMAGYGLSQLRPPGSRFLYLLFILGLTLPAEALITPLYYEVRDLGLLGTRFALILPLIALFVPFGVFWMKTNFDSIPPELTEAAQLDGASSWQNFFRVQLPLVISGWSSLSILFFLWTWNQFLLVIVLVNDPDQGNMAAALGTFQGEHGTDVVLLCAGALIIIAPSLLVFIIFQRYFVRALLQGAIK